MKVVGCVSLASEWRPPQHTICLVSYQSADESVRLASIARRHTLKVEPKAGDTLAENLNPQGALRYSMSTLHCLTVSLARGGEGIGAMMGERKVRELAEQAGFTRFRRLPIEHAAQVFYEIRP